MGEILKEIKQKYEEGILLDKETGNPVSEEKWDQFRNEDLIKMHYYANEIRDMFFREIQEVDEPDLHGWLAYTTEKTVDHELRMHYKYLDDGSIRGMSDLTIEAPIEHCVPIMCCQRVWRE